MITKNNDWCLAFPNAYKYIEIPELKKYHVKDYFSFQNDMVLHSVKSITK